MHPRLRAGLRPVRCGRPGFGGRASCPVAKGGPSWPAPRAGHAALSGRPPPLHRGTQDQEQKLLRQGLPRFALPGSPPGRGEQAEEKPEGARAGCARVRRLYRDVLPTNPGACSRSARAWMPAHRDLEGALSLVTFFGQAKKVTRPPGRRTKPNRDERRVGAKRYTRSHWVPAFAGTTKKIIWTPAFAG